MSKNNSTVLDEIHDEETSENGSAVAESEVNADESEVTTADSDVATADPDGATAESGVGRLRTTIRRALPGIAALLIVGLAGATSYLGWQQHQRKVIDDAGAAAERAASAYAVTLTSVDTANLDANFQAVLDGSTGEFRDSYTRSSTQLRQLLIDHKATGRGVVLQTAVKSATADEVVVLLFVDQTVTNTEMPDARVDRSRIVMTMRQVDGQWKAAKVDIP